MCYDWLQVIYHNSEETENYFKTLFGNTENGFKQLSDAPAKSYSENNRPVASATVSCRPTAR